jgi:hypothetical protein
VEYQGVTDWSQLEDAFGNSTMFVKKKSTTTAKGGGLNGDPIKNNV